MQPTSKTALSKHVAYFADSEGKITQSSMYLGFRKLGFSRFEAFGRSVAIAGVAGAVIESCPFAKVSPKDVHKMAHPSCHSGVFKSDGTIDNAAWEKLKGYAQPGKDFLSQIDIERMQNEAVAKDKEKDPLGFAKMASQGEWGDLLRIACDHWELVGTEYIPCITFATLSSVFNDGDAVFLRKERGELPVKKPAVLQESVKQEDLERCIKQLLPKEETGDAVGKIKEIQKIEGGFRNDIWCISLENAHFVFRRPKKKEATTYFARILEVHKVAQKLKIAPSIVAENVEEQQMLMQHIESAPWPTYKENSQPYKATMKVLACFHQAMQPLAKDIKNTVPMPFSFIFLEAEKLEKVARLPKQFQDGIQRIKLIYEKLKKDFEQYPTITHGDFHKGNVLLQKGGTKKQTTTPFLIDFDECSVGHPFFDVAKFSVPLAQEERYELFCDYLGAKGRKRKPTTEEQSSFELIDQALLMVIATNRFKLAHNHPKMAEEGLSKEELEAMLTSDTPLPSFLSPPFADSSPKARQRGAVYALGEFLQRSSSGY